MSFIPTWEARLNDDQKDPLRHAFLRQVGVGRQLSTEEDHEDHEELAADLSGVGAEWRVAGVNNTAVPYQGGNSVGRRSGWLTGSC